MSSTTIRNRRLTYYCQAIAFRDSGNSGNYEFFEDSQVSERLPGLYHHYIGRYSRTIRETKLSSIILNAFDKNNDMSDSSGTHFGDFTIGTLSSENVDDDDDLSLLSSAHYFDAPEEEKIMMRREFDRILCERFVSGRESKRFDYSLVDNDSSLSLSRNFENDMDDIYFDEISNDTKEKNTWRNCMSERFTEEGREGDWDY